MNNIVIGQYIPGDGFLYRIDPRIKIVSLVFMMITVFMISNIVNELIALFVILLIIVVSRISLIKIFNGLKPLLFLFMFTLIIQLSFNHSGTVLVKEPMSITALGLGLIFIVYFVYRFFKSFVKYKMLLLVLFIGIVYIIQRYIFMSVSFYDYTLIIYSGGLNMAGYVLLRLICIVMLSILLTITTTPTEINLALEWLLHPLKLIKFNVEEFTLIISISLRFIPTLIDEANKIILAQASRGVDFMESSIRKKITQVISLLVPMFIIAFQRSEDLAYAMEARGFIPGEPRSKIEDLKFRLIDLFALLLVVLLFTISVIYG